jgi:hypothetical protein
MGLLLHLRMASRWSSVEQESMIGVSNAAQRKYCTVQAGAASGAMIAGGNIAPETTD